MAWDVVGMVNVALAVYPAQEKLRLLTQLETWVAEQKALALAQVDQQQQQQPRGPGVHRAQPRAQRVDVVDADFEEP